MRGAVAGYNNNPKGARKTLASLIWLLGRFFSRSARYRPENSEPAEKKTTLRALFGLTLEAFLPQLRRSLVNCNLRVAVFLHRLGTFDCMSFSSRRQVFELGRIISGLCRLPNIVFSPPF